MRVLRTVFLTLTFADLASAPLSAQTLCSSTTACAVYQNTSSGPAIHAQSIGGYGIRSNSGSGGGLLGTTTSGSFLAPGVEGESGKQSGLDAGGAFGIAGIATPSSTPAIGAYGYGRIQGFVGTTNAVGSSESYGYGVEGIDNVSSAPDSNIGVFGNSEHAGTGVLGAANGTPQSGLLGSFPIGVYAVAETRNSDAIGLEAESDDYAAEVRNSHDNTVVDISPVGYLLRGYVDPAVVEFSFDEKGNESLTGALTTSKGTYSRTTGADGHVKMSYGYRATTPELEDIGESQLIDGRAAVRIDADLGDVIDRRVAYHVFLTPEGDCNGLYIAQKGTNGFVVRELRGGRSTLAFEYRIVGKPVDDNGARLAAVAPEHAGTHPLPVSTTHMAPSLTPLERLRQELGAAGYAKAIADFAKRERAK